jgi:hypothetical protein
MGQGNGVPESCYGPAGQLEQVILRFICQFWYLSKNRKVSRGYQTIREGFYLFRLKLKLASTFDLGHA